MWALGTTALDGKCVRTYDCSQSRIYRLRKGDDLFFLETPPLLRPGIPYCKDIWQNFNAISFIACSCTRQQALALDHSSMVDAALRLKSLPTPGLCLLLLIEYHLLARFNVVSFCCVSFPVYCHYYNFYSEPTVH